MNANTDTGFRNFLDACNARDLDLVASFFSPDAVYLGSIGSEDDGTSFIGHEQVCHGMDAFLNSHTEVKYTDIDVTIAGDRGFATWTFTGTRSNAETYSFRGVDILAFDDEGRISRKDAFRKERGKPIDS